jgi:hypothetical protein
MEDSQNENRGKQVAKHARQNWLGGRDWGRKTAGLLMI